MTSEKSVLFCRFKPESLKATDEMRQWFSGSYPRFFEMETVEFKCWWCDQERKEWGAFYIFESREALDEYVASDTWQKLVPEKYGCKPSWTILEPGPILAKKIITAAENSWITN
jgi:hypothetical protein